MQSKVRFADKGDQREIKGTKGGILIKIPLSAPLGPFRSLLPFLTLFAVAPFGGLADACIKAIPSEQADTHIVGSSLSITD